jgi:release factor glutamine methyltransferase
MRLLRLPGVFSPISDSWMLASMLRHEPIAAGASVLDLCTGSGLLAAVAGGCGAGEVWAVDVSRRALLAARVNGALNGVRVRARRGDLFHAVPGRRFDVIVSNPPYVPGPSRTARGLERAWEAGPTGRVFLDRICAEAPAHLNRGGVLLLVHSTMCGEQETLDALRAGGLEAEVAFRHVGRLGPLLRDRAGWLRQRGLLAAEEDEVIVVRAQAPAGRPPSPGAYQPPRQSMLAARRRDAAILACLRLSSLHWISEKVMMIRGKNAIAMNIE